MPNSTRYYQIITNVIKLILHLSHPYAIILLNLTVFLLDNLMQFRGDDVLTGELKKQFEDEICSLLMGYMIAHNELPYQEEFIDEVTNQFLIEIIKMSYDADMTKYSKSFRQYTAEFYKDYPQETIRKLLKTDFDKVKKRRQVKADQIKEHFGYYPSDLIIPDLRTMSEKKKGSPDQFLYRAL